MRVRPTGEELLIIARRVLREELLPLLPKLELASEPELVAGSLHVGGIKRMMVRARS